MLKEVSRFLDWATTLGGLAHPRITRFLRYNVAAGIATVVDFVLLWLFTDVAGIYYLISAAMAFAIGSGINYGINRVWGFKGTKTGIVKGYISFLLIGLGGLFLTVGLLAFFVEVLNMNYLIARILAVFFIVFWNYFMNSWLTFKLG